MTAAGLPMGGRPQFACVAQIRSETGVDAGAR